MYISAEMAVRIDEAIATLETKPTGHINGEGVRHGALPLAGTIGEVWLLRSDGSFWRSDADSGLKLEPLPDELHTIALVAGAELFPWLRELLPSRPANAVTCGSCEGRGRIGPDGLVFCRTCDALGWRASDE
jgi:hypothetical protein